MIRHLAVRDRRVVVEAARAVRQRIDAGDVPADRVYAVRRDDVVRERRSDDLPGGRVDPRGQRIVDWDELTRSVAEVAEVAAADRRGRNAVDKSQPARFLQAGVVGEEEGAAVPVGTTPGTTSAPPAAAPN